jgi:hypothetical protein
MGDVGRRLAEIWRILKPAGLYQGTMLSKRDAQFGRGRPVAPDTFIHGSDSKAHPHPHYYCDLASLAALFVGFEILSLTQEEQRRPGFWHWHIVAERGRTCWCTTPYGLLRRIKFPQRSNLATTRARAVVGGAWAAPLTTQPLS